MPQLWRDDPDLKDRFHPDYPDDLQVIVHDGSFRFTDTRPEVMWATIVNRLEWTHQTGETGYAYKAILLNVPQQLKTVKQGAEILLVAHKDYKFPIHVTHEYIMERDFYNITPCSNCGLPELFDPITKLAAKSFPDMDKDKESVEMMAFTSFCPMCGNKGFLVIEHKGIQKNE
jgi:predicted nucleic-acid-binding Zn-ribbon protein